jgi:hypothetical protein
MIAMGSLRKRETRKEISTELSHLSKGFQALTIDHQKGVLRTARGLLRIQRAHKMMVTDNTRYVDFSQKGKNG